MDLFDLLRNNLPPAKKMVNAIVAKNALLVEQILKSSFNVNAVIYEQGGQTALHVAVTSQNYNEDVVKKLIAYGASPSLEDSFGDTPIYKATVHNNNAEVVKVLLQRDESSTSMDSFWQSLQYLNPVQNERRLICRNIAVVLIATPNFLKYPESRRKNSFVIIHMLEGSYESFDLTAYYDCLKLFFIFDKNLWNSLSDSDSTTDEGEKFIAWFENHKKEVPSLQHLCRMAIRKSFDGNVNVLHGANQLNLPNSLKQFLTFCDITDLCM